MSTEGRPFPNGRPPSHDGADEFIRELGLLPTAAISDALDRAGLVGQCEGIGALDGTVRLIGRAYTVRYRPVGRLRRGSVGDFLDDVPPHHVVAIDNGGRVDHTVWGGIMTKIAKARDIGGTVIDGACRDMARALELRYPLFVRGTFMRTGKDRVELESIGETVVLGEVRVRAGDILVGDADGLVVVPQEAAQSIVSIAQEIVRVEHAIETAVDEGSALRDARSRFGYHSLSIGTTG